METARAILQHAISVFPGKKSLYRALAHLERQHGTPEAVAEVLERGVKYCPQVCCSLHKLLFCEFLQITHGYRLSIISSKQLFSKVHAYRLMRPRHEQ